MVRSFIAIESNKKVQNALKKVQNTLEETGADLKIVKPENVHLTLKFLGDIPDSKIISIKEKLREAKKPEPFSIQVSGLGVFPNRSYIRVIWCGVEKNSEKISSLKKQVDEKMKEINFSEEDKDFTPHFTIARVKSGKAKDKINSIIDENSRTRFGEIEIDEIKLKESELTPQGPIYSDIEKFPLS